MEMGVGSEVRIASGLKGSKSGVLSFRGKERLSTGERIDHEAANLRPTFNSQCLLAQAYQPLWLVEPDDLYHRFT
jgi:hypothetical protein